MTIAPPSPMHTFKQVASTPANGICLEAPNSNEIPKISFIYSACFFCLPTTILYFLLNSQYADYFYLLAHEESS